MASWYIFLLFQLVILSAGDDAKLRYVRRNQLTEARREDPKAKKADVSPKKTDAKASKQASAPKKTEDTSKKPSEAVPKNANGSKTDPTDTESTFQSTRDKLCEKKSPRFPSWYKVFCLKHLDAGRVLKIQSYKSSRLSSFTTFTFSAPHPLPLCRDGHQVHKPEEWTGFLADQFARSLNGSVLTWIREEINTQEAIYAEARKSKPEEDAEPDRKNRDPNHLLRKELHTSPWFQALRSFVDNANPKRNPPQLLVDIHGMRNPRFLLIPS